MIDLTAGFQLNSKFFMGINAAQGIAVNPVDKKYWGGVALYSNYSFTDKLGLGVRAEYFDNTQGVQYIGSTDVTSITVTGKITLADGHLLLKPEFRVDTYKKTGINGGERFEDDNGVLSKNSQSTLGLVAIYKF